jgi:hypothetical protein
MTLTEEIMQAAFSATDDRKREALKVLRGEPSIADAETLRRCSGQAEPFLTLQEVGRRLNVSACSLWRWACPGHQLGGRRRFRMSEVEAYLASNDFKKRAEELKEERRLPVPETTNPIPRRRGRKRKDAADARVAVATPPSPQSGLRRGDPAVARSEVTMGR